VVALINGFNKADKDMKTASDLINVVKEAARGDTTGVRSSDRVYGTVTQVNPLRIQLDGREQPMNESFFELSDFVKPKSVKFPAKFTGTIRIGGDVMSAEFDGEIESGGLWGGLQVGDKVVCTSHNDRQRYFVHGVTGTVGAMSVPVTGVRIDRFNGRLPYNVGENIMQAGETLDVTVRVSPDSALQRVTWSSSEPGVAAVDHFGRVTAVSPGSARITATAVTSTAGGVFLSDAFGLTVKSKIEHRNSPNQSNGRQGHTPDFIVCHITEGAFDGAVSWITNPASQVSYHFVVARDGRIVQTVDIANMAWANGTTTNGNNMDNRHSTIAEVRERNVNANLFTVSISFEGIFEDTQGALAEKQLSSAVWLINHIRGEVKRIYGFEIPSARSNIVGHNEITPINRPNCPGEKFPYDELLRRLRNN
jgi:N-acetyl-anhydromuramyl-L-alanine amidase AmpD